MLSRIDPEKLSLASAYHDEHQGFHTFDIKHGDEIIGTLSGNHDGEGRLNIRTVRLNKRFGSTAEARGALGTRGVMKLGRELRRHGYHTAWSNSRATGMRSSSRFRSGGEDYSIVPYTRLPEGVLDEREYDVRQVDTRDVLLASARLGTKKEMRAARRAAPRAGELFSVEIQHAGQPHAQATYGLMDGPDDNGPAGSHAHIIWAKNATATDDGRSSAVRHDPGAFRALVSHIRKHHPAVKTISANRVTGRNQGDRLWTLPPMRESIADALILQKLRESAASGPTTFDIENETLRNRAFRRVLHTSPKSQLVTMHLQPGEDIGVEVHHDVDQFIRIEKGRGKAVLDGTSYAVQAGSAVLVPAGTRHNIVNASQMEPLSLYTIYSPAKHPAGEVDLTKPVSSRAGGHHS